MASHSLPVVGHLLLSAGIPSESTEVCFMQSDGIIMTESTIFILMGPFPCNIVGEQVQQFCVEYKKYDQIYCIMCDFISLFISNNNLQ